MARMIHCKKLDREAEGLDRPPYPGPLGQRIYEDISKQAWQDWICLLYTSPSPRDQRGSRMPSSA